MPYLFVFLVALNASYFGYQVLQEKDPAALQPIANMTHKDFPVTLKLVSQRTVLDQLSNLSLKPNLSLNTQTPSTS
ncbi:MAG: hypothetical protein KGO49_09610 [Gammaproteobacteria bacterium]|nr:hypothetical protein [Gammaproteobacteria bacterium]